MTNMERKNGGVEKKQDKPKRFLSEPIEKSDNSPASVIFKKSPKGESQDNQLNLGLKDKFISAFSDYTEKGVTKTQEKKIDQLLKLLKEGTEDSDSIITEISETREKNGLSYEGDMWVYIDNLMQKTEQVTGKSVRYTPSEFAESLQPFAQQEENRFLSASKEKREAQGEGELAIDSSTREALGTKADEVFKKPTVIRKIMRDFIHDRNMLPEVYVRNKGEAGSTEEAFDLAENYIETHSNEQAFHGMMRSLELCGEASAELLPALQETFPELGFVITAGNMSGLYHHEAILAFPDKVSQQSLSDLQERTNQPVISLEGFEDQHTPVLDTLTVIDPTILQTFNDNPFLKDIRFDERLAFAKELIPDSFSEGGIFVGPMIDYVRFLGKIGIRNPEFYCFKDEHAE